MISTVEKADYTDAKVKKKNRAQDVIPIQKMYESGMRKLEGGRYAITYEIKDIDYSSRSDDDRQRIFEAESRILNSFDGSRSVYNYTIYNRRINKKRKLQKSLISTTVLDGYDDLRLAYNRLRYDDVEGDKGFVKSKYLTISTYRAREDKADGYFNRAYNDLSRKYMMMESGLKVVNANTFAEIIYDFMNAGHESEFNYIFNENDKKDVYKDYMSPSYIKFHNDYFEINDKVGRVMMLKTLGGSINDDFLIRLSDIKTNFCLSLDIIPVSNGEARKLIDRKDDDVEGNADAWSNKSRIKEGSAIRIPRQVKRDRKVIDEYIKYMDDYNQKMFLNQIVMVFLADNMEELQDYTDSIYETAAESSSQMCILYAQQLQGLQTALPFGVRRINNLRDCNTETTACMTIFDQVKLDHDTGIPFGRHEQTRQQQMVDVRRLMNGHIWVFGKSGSGKSMNVKEKSIYELLLTDGDVIYVDVDGEYPPVVNYMGGQMINVGIDSINVADIVLDFGDTNNPIDPVKDSCSNVINFINRILKEPMSDIEESLVDRCMRKLYDSVIEGHQICVTLGDLYDFLLASDLREGQLLAVKIEKYVTGSFNCFAKPTSVDINSRITCYNLSTLDEHMRYIGMDVVMDHIERRLIKNRKFGRATYIIFEEMDHHLTDPNARVRIKEFFERSRKYGGFITALIQNITRILQVPEAHTMLLNAETVIMHKQEKDDAEELARMYGLSNIQMRTLMTAEPGHGINKIGDVIYDFDCTIPKDNIIYDIINTDLKGA